MKLTWKKKSTRGCLTNYTIPEFPKWNQISEFDHVGVRNTYCVKIYGAPTRFFETRHQVEDFIMSLLSL